MTAASILIVDDDPNVRLALFEALARNNHKIVLAEDGQAAVKVIDKTPLDLIITDLKMPKLDGMDVLLEAKKRFPDLPVVMLTGYGTIENAVETMKKGAFDYILKPCSVEVLEHVVERALGTRRGAHIMKGQPASENRMPPAPTLVTRNARMQGILDIAGSVATSRATVFIQGESGTGKELLARFIHAESERKDKPFIAVNCAALPEGLLESELFGHEKGAFTGAITRKMGKFELAQTGTILLDEISEMQIQLQAKLLRVLQENEIDRVGGKVPIAIDVRVIATTNRDIEAMVKKGEFREDLYYRLNVIPLKIPPLRERKEDIPALCDYFVKKYSQLYGRQVQGVSPETSEYLLTLPWKGNVRELENTVERAVLLCTGKEVTRQSLMLDDIAVKPPGEKPTSLTGTAPLKDMEREQILKALGETDGNRTYAAKILGISVRTLRNKLQEYRLHGWVE
ncbi:MAG: sigma-54 dependent transcriptional regulator [Deltaproteobacteria bacterium]|nr:sigma-54 dependent transcriptional regulator [Deltaproteobacteria bacterium]